jgi:hypothetical protein
LDCLRVLIESKGDVNATEIVLGVAPSHKAVSGDHPECLRALLEAKADVNAKSTGGHTPVMFACHEEHLSCLQLLVDAKAELNAKDSDGINALHWAISLPPHSRAHSVPGMPFAVLSCNTDKTNMFTDDEVTPSMVKNNVDEYKHVHTFIDEYHGITSHTLAEDVVVDKRVGRRGNGLYHEPLEQVLLYLGLSMEKDQTVNASIDGKSVKRALIPGHPTNANLWFQLHTRVSWGWPAVAKKNPALILKHKGQKKKKKKRR